MDRCGRTHSMDNRQLLVYWNLSDERGKALVSRHPSLGPGGRLGLGAQFGSSFGHTSAFPYHCLLHQGLPEAHQAGGRRGGGHDGWIHRI